MKRNHLGQRVGEWHHRAKVPDDDVRLMRALVDEGMRISVVARKFEHNYRTVWDICTYRTRPL